MRCLVSASGCAGHAVTLLGDDLHIDMQIHATGFRKQIHLKQEDQDQQAADPHP